MPPSDDVGEAKPRDAQQCVFTLADVAKHNTADDLWLAIDGGVYDVTSYLKQHPGGQVLATWAGRDASDVFTAWHTDGVRRKLPRFRVGTLAAPADADAAARAAGFADAATLVAYEADKKAMLKSFADRGYYDTDFRVYARAFATPPALFLLSIVIVLLTSTWQAHALAGLVLGLGWHQVAWIGHDVMHSSVLKGRVRNHVLGCLYGNFFGGISVGWWKYTHDMHHATTNEHERDPDITHLPFVAVTEKMFLSANARPLTAVELALLKVAVPLQHLTYLPIMFVAARFNLYWQSIYMLFVGHRVLAMPFQSVHYGAKVVNAERLALVGFWLWYLAVCYAAYARAGAAGAFAYFAVSHLYMGVLHVQISLSHWERPHASACEKSPREKEWFYHQIVTARDITPTAFMNWYMGGLNLQCAHHIAPRVARHHLPAATVEVRNFCRKWNIPYTESGMLPAVWEVASSLCDVAGKVKQLDERRAAALIRKSE